MVLEIAESLADQANNAAEVSVELLANDEVESLESAEELAGLIGAPDGHPKGGVHHWSGDPSPKRLAELQGFHAKRFAVRRMARGGRIGKQLASAAARSYIGGIPMIPREELATWPSTARGAPMDYLVQLSRADFPELPWPNDSTLLQVFKTPVEDEDDYPFTEGIHLRWGKEIAPDDVASEESLPAARGYRETSVLEQVGGRLIEPMPVHYEHAGLLDVLPTDADGCAEADELGWLELADEDDGFSYRVDVRGPGAANLGGGVTMESVVLQIGGYPALWHNPPGSYRLTPGSQPMLVLLNVYFDEGEWCVLQCPRTGAVRSSFG